MHQSLNRGTSHELPHDVPHCQRGPNLTCHTTRTPPVRRDSVDAKPLPQAWQFPSEARYFKCMSGALDRLGRSKFEHNVTKGFILENSIGFHWVANGRYLLFKKPEVGDEDEHGIKMEQSHLENLGSAVHVQDLFSEHEDTTPKPITTAVDAHLKTHVAPITPLGESLLQKRPMHKKSILKLRPQIQNIGLNAPRAESLSPVVPPPVPQDFTYTPLSHRWSIPKNALYKGAYPDATANLTEETIERRVRSGHLIVDDIGIRDAHAADYRLLYMGQRDEKERIYTKTIKPYDVPCTPTPIVERNEVAALPKDRVKFNMSSLSLDGLGILQEEKVVDNEGKSRKMQRVGSRKGKGRSFWHGRRAGRCGQSRGTLSVVASLQCNDEDDEE